MTDPAKPYAVIMRDNFDYMDDDATYEQGRYATYEEALRVCKDIVEASLRHHRKPGMNAQQLYEQYVAFGDDPSITGPDAAPFSAWEYAKERCGGDSGIEAPLIRMGTADDALAVLAIWREAAAWLAAKGCPLWKTDMFTLQIARDHAAAGELIVGSEGGVVCACMLLQTDDPIHWPEKEKGSALYLHKLAVRRDHAGRGWGNALIAWAAERAKSLGVPLRLDCDPRPALMNLYLANGFLPVDDGPIQRGDFMVVRYERA